MDLQVVILAAGQGKRMHSALPKVLHELGGTPLLAHVIQTARTLSERPPIVVHGHGGEQLMAALGEEELVWVEQEQQLGTGHAVLQALPSIDTSADVLVLYADVPMLRPATLEQLVAKRAARNAELCVLTAVLDDADGYGRIVRDPVSDTLLQIVEDKDASDAQREINEINTGIMLMRGEDLHRWLPSLENHNAQGEYYLTDCVEVAVADGHTVVAYTADDAHETMGINNRLQLAQAERNYQQRLANQLMLGGVTLADPLRCDVRGSLSCGKDVLIDVNAVFVGEVVLGDGVTIGPNVVLTNTQIGSGAKILANCVIEAAQIGEHCEIGPFSRIRPETRLEAGAKIGNFVEVKKSHIGPGSKVNHLAYVGDAEIGSKVNVGAGTITCNYDGANKHKTVIEDGAFIGSDSQLVAPVRIGRGVTVGAGTTVTQDVEPEVLVISRVKQKTISNWSRPKKTPKN
ncbi:MAG: bifunctional UDP-N-acetylglucosamine diphosphorylase/glucosamine-1-phosphate N-acetyltransferase GlmU [Pseudomonadota bacterium]